MHRIEPERNLVLDCFAPKEGNKTYLDRFRALSTTGLRGEAFSASAASSARRFRPATGGGGVVSRSSSSSLTMSAGATTEGASTSEDEVGFLKARASALAFIELNADWRSMGRGCAESTCRYARRAASTAAGREPLKWVRIRVVHPTCFRRSRKCLAMERMGRDVEEDREVKMALDGYGS